MTEHGHKYRISEENGVARIELPLEDVHSLLVSLEPCPCKSTKSNATAGIRERLAKGLGKLVGVQIRKRTTR